MKEKNTGIIVFSSIIVTFFLLEIISRFYLHNFTSHETFRRYASLRQLENNRHSQRFKFDFHRYLGYVPSPNYSNGKNKHNSLGFRGEDFSVKKKSGTYRIVCIGGSTTYTSFIEDYKKSYPYLMEQELKAEGYKNIEVINSGSGGWRSYESLINLQFRLLELDPDLIIIYHSVNDIMSRFVWPPEKYRADNSGHLTPRFTRIFMPSFFENSTLVRSLLILGNYIRPHAAMSRINNKFNKKTFFGKEFTYQKEKGNYPQGIFTEVPAIEMLKKNKPIYFENNIRSIVNISQTNNVEVLISSFAYSEKFTDRAKSSSEEFLYAYAEQNKILQEISIQTNAYFFDFAKAFPKSKHYYQDGHHVTEEGAKLKAKLFSEYLISNLFLPLHHITK